MDAMEIFNAMGKETVFCAVPDNHLFIGADFQIYKKVKDFTRGVNEYNAWVIEKNGGQQGRPELFAYSDWAFLFNPGL